MSLAANPWLIEYVVKDLPSYLTAPFPNVSDPITAVALLNYTTGAICW
jgi:hypothetical protein